MRLEPFSFTVQSLPYLIQLFITGDEEVLAEPGEHLPGAKDPIRGGRKVQVQQKASIAEAEASEQRIITRAKPRANTYISRDAWRDAAGLQYVT